MKEKVLDEYPEKKAMPADQKSRLIYLQPLMIVLLVFIPFSIGYFSGIAILLPLLTGIPAGIVLIKHLSKGAIYRAILDMILYVFWLSIIGIILMYYFHDRASDVVIRSEEYWSDMELWLKGDPSKQGTPSEFIPEHIKHTVTVSVASLISAGMIGINFGTVLMNYMNYYVATIMLMSDSPLLLAIIGWHPYSVCRVIGFIILGCTFSWVFVSRFSKESNFNRRIFVFLIILGLCLELLDILLKIYIAPGWRDLIVANISFQ